jgi:hypothetical protein
MGDHPAVALLAEPEREPQPRLGPLGELVRRPAPQQRLRVGDIAAGGPSSSATAQPACNASSACSQSVTYSIRTMIPSLNVITWWYISVSSSAPLPFPRP